MTEPREILNSHLNLCEQIYQLLLEENSILRQTGESAPLELLHQKEDLLPVLKHSVSALKSIERGYPMLKEAIEAAQKKSMKIFHLTRENEQLLLSTGSSGLNRIKNQSQKFSSAEVKRAYKV